ncbi:MAG: LVIVD repeat-containing protein [Candidatus Thorarchaeota archaeon]
MIVNPIITVNCLESNSETIYLNKIAVCNFEVGYRIVIDNNFTYVSDNDGVIIIDIDNPVKPKKIGRIELEDGAFGIEIREHILFIAADSLGLVIANFSDINHPEILGQTSSTGSGYCIAIYGNICYLGNMGQPMNIFNITNLTQPTFIKTLSTYVFDDFIIKGDVLFGASPNSGLVIFNISDPINPSLIKTVAGSYGANALAIKDEVIYVGCHMYGVKAVDISTLSSATIIDSLDQDDEGEAIGLSITGNYLCVADNWGVEIINITTPTNIVKVAEYRSGIDAAHDLKTVGNFVFVAKGMGLGVFEISSTSKIYFPPYLYYVIPIICIVIIGGIGLLVVKRKKKYR